MKKISVILIFILSCSVACMASSSKIPEKRTVVSGQETMGLIDKSLQNEVNASIRRGLDWLAEQQMEDGSFSNKDFPALTALALQAFIKGEHPHKKEIIDKGVAFILSCVRKNGGIYADIEGTKGGGLSSYNTAICMTTLHMTGDSSLVKVIQDARKFLSGAQYTGDDVYRGGFGYERSTQRAYTDLLNTYYAVEAMAETADVEDLRPRGEEKVDINWDETVKFISNMQNPESAGPDAGGFVYNPTDSKAGLTTNETGSVIFRSYGSITYSGLLALLHADVSRDDVRVRSAFSWATEHWSLDENPGMGDQGLFFFFNIITKALSTYGADVIQPKDGSEAINWRSAMADRLVKTQTVEAKGGKGYWVNENGRFWENDPVLTTSYALIALETL